MATLKEILDTLSPQEKRLLDYAFEHEVGQFVELPNGRYIGVNLNSKIKNFQPEIQIGVWSSGKIIRNGY